MDKSKKIDDVLKGLLQKKSGFDIVLIHIDSFYLLGRCNPGILSLATVLHNKGYRVKVLTPPDLYCLSLEDMEFFFQQARPSIAGFYTNSDNIHSVREMTRRVKQWAPAAKIVAGGPLASALGEEMLKWPYFDAVICGEGERGLSQYADAVIHGTVDMKAVPSLIYREGTSVVANPRGPLIENLDELPYPDYSLIGARPQVLTITSGRGCPFGCAFCFQAVHGRTYRYRSPENVVDEIRQNLEKYDLKTFSLADDTFVADPPRVRKICDLLKKYRDESGRKFGFYCEARVDIMARNPDLLPRLKEVGLIRVQVGIESGVQRIVDAYGKGILLTQVEELVDRVRDMGGVSMVGHFIVGGAFETEETLRKSEEFARSLLRRAPGVFETGVGFLCAFPGTRISKNPEKFDILVHDADFRDNLSTLEASCSTESLSIESLRVMKQHFHDAIQKEMKKNCARIPYETMKDQVRWATEFGMTSFWLPYLKEREAVEKYFFFQASPRFFRLEKKRDSMIPMRTMALLTYDRDGKSLKIQGGFKKFSLTDEVKIFIYKRSCGKNTLQDIAREVRDRFFPEKSVEEVVNKTIMPFYRLLEKNFYMAFYE